MHNPNFLSDILDTTAAWDCPEELVGCVITDQLRVRGGGDPEMPWLPRSVAF